MAVISRSAQGLAADLGAHRFETFRRSRRRDRHQIAGGFGEAPERRFGKADFVGAHQGVVVGDEKGGEQHFRIAAQFDPAKSAKDFRAQRLRLPRNDDDVLASGIEIDASNFQLRAGCVGRVHWQGRWLNEFKPHWALLLQSRLTQIMISSWECAFGSLGESSVGDIGHRSGDHGPPCKTGQRCKNYGLSG